MNRLISPEMLDALRLTRQGRLRQAVAALRPNLARATPHAPPPAPQKSSPLDLLAKPLLRAPAAPSLAGLAAQLARGVAEPFLPDPVAPTAPGQRFITRQFSSAAGARDYKLFIPSAYHGQKLPLILMLHGCTQNPDDFAIGTRMNALAEAAKCFVAYPAQARSANLQKCWNWFNASEQHRGAGEPAILAGIAREIMAEYNIAPGRVFAAGLSAGGAAAAILGATYPELFAAIGVHSGLACGAASDLASGIAAMRQGAQNKLATAEHALPAIVFHGDRDPTVNIANAAQIIAQAGGGGAFEKHVQQGATPAGMAYTRTNYTDRRGRDVLEEWVLHGAGHAWSGGDAAGSFTEPRGPDASREMLRFFMEQV